MAQRVVRFRTSGMHCRSCSMLIEMELAELDGVSEVSSDHAAGATIVSFDDGLVSEQDIEDKIGSLGYEATREG